MENQISKLKNHCTHLMKYRVGCDLDNPFLKNRAQTLLNLIEVDQTSEVVQETFRAYKPFRSKVNKDVNSILSSIKNNNNGFRFESVSYLRLVKEFGVADVCYGVGMVILSSSSLGEVGRRQSRLFFDRGYAEESDTRCAYELGFCFLSDEIDSTMSARLFQEASDKEYPPAMLYLGKKLLGCCTDKVDYKGGTELLLQLIENEGSITDVACQALSALYDIYKEERHLQGYPAYNKYVWIARQGDAYGKKVSKDCEVTSHNIRIRGRNCNCFFLNTENDIAKLVLKELIEVQSMSQCGMGAMHNGKECYVNFLPFVREDGGDINYAISLSFDGWGRFSIDLECVARDNGGDLTSATSSALAQRIHHLQKMLEQEDVKRRAS